MNDNERNDLQEIVDAAIDEMARESRESLDPSNINLAEFFRLTNLSRGKARTIKKNGFKAMPHGRCGLKAKTIVLTGYTGLLDDLLRKGVTNSEVCFDRIAEQGYKGGLTSVRVYLRDHAHLVSVKRKTVESRTSCGQRFTTPPGEAFQMDWGFFNGRSRGVNHGGHSKTCRSRIILEREVHSKFLFATVPLKCVPVLSSNSDKGMLRPVAIFSIVSREMILRPCSI